MSKKILLKSLVDTLLMRGGDVFCCELISWHHFQMGKGSDYLRPMPTAIGSPKSSAGMDYMHGRWGGVGSGGGGGGCFSGISTVQTRRQSARRGVINNNIRDGCSTLEYFFDMRENLILSLLEHSVFTGPRCLWGPVYGFPCLYLPTYIQHLFETLPMWLWRMMIPTQF